MLIVENRPFNMLRFVEVMYQIYMVVVLVAGARVSSILVTPPFGVTNFLAGFFLFFVGYRSYSVIRRTRL